MFCRRFHFPDFPHCLTGKLATRILAGPSSLFISKHFMLPIGIACTILANASEIAWDKVSLDSSMEPTVEWRSFNNHYWLYMGLSYTRDGENWTIAAVSSIPEFYGCVYEANLGETVGNGTAVPSTIFAENRPWSPETRVWTPVSGNGNSDVFLAFILYDNSRLDGYEADPIYGWMKFNTSDNLILTESAIGLDGCPIIVGGGAWTGGAIPEPSSAVLMLVGLAWLALRRRRHVRRDLL